MLVFPAAPRYSKSRRTQTENLTGVFAVEIPLQEFERAAQRLKGVLHHTELDLSATFSAMTAATFISSTKTARRPARSRSAARATRSRRSSSAARPGPSWPRRPATTRRGVAYAAHRFGIPATIVMPKTAPIAKAKATEGYGATVVLAGDCYDDAYAKACEICEQEHATFLHPYNDPEVIAGSGARSASRSSATSPRRTSSSCRPAAADCLPVWPRASSRSTPAYRSSACRPRARMRSHSRSIRTATSRPTPVATIAGRHRRQGAGRHHRPAHPEIRRRRRHRQRS